MNAIPPAEEGGETTYKRINMPMYKIWEQMEALVDKGLAKSIGISNFNVQLTWDMLSYCRIKPVCNEIELNPVCVQEQLVKYLKDNGIEPIAYCPVAKGHDTSRLPDLTETEEVKTLMAKYGKSGMQILLNWGLQRGHILIPKSNTPSRIKENI